MMKDLETRWLKSFGAFPPIGYVCREELPARWLRIHSLPRSKRNPDTEPEYQELLRRHNEVATTLLGAGEPCILFACTFDDDEHPLSHGDLTFTDVPALSVPHAGIAAAAVVWEPGRFDALIRAVADETAQRFLFASFERNTAYAPYDGGADLFLASPEEVAKMKARWSAWLTTRADGM